MPARNARIRVYMQDPAQDQVMDFPLWWDRRAFFAEYGYRKTDTGNPFYVDYAYDLTPQEALEWDDEARARFSADPNNLKPHIVSAMQELYAALKEAKRVVVEDYEWESGLD